MTFANGAKAQDESTAIFRGAGLVGIADDARIEQGRCLERVLVEEIRADQAPLRLAQCGMLVERRLHLSGTCLENIEQIPMATFEVLEHVAQLLGGSFGIEPKYPVDNMIGPDLIGRVEVARLSRRLEGPDDDSGRIRAQ